MSEKVCECIESLRLFISHITDAITFGMEHNFIKAKEYVDVAKKALDEFEKCSKPVAPFFEAREFIEKGKKALDEFKDAEAKEHLKMA